MWITSKPDFSLQCDKTFAKATQSLGLIKRTFIHVRPSCFYTKLTYIEYCVSIWSPYLATRDIDKQEN